MSENNDLRTKIIAILFLILGFIGDIVGNIIVNKAPVQNPFFFYVIWFTVLSISTIFIAIASYYLLELSNKRDWFRTNLKYFSLATITVLMVDVLYLTINAPGIFLIDTSKLNAFLSRTYINIPLLFFTIVLLLFSIMGHSIRRIYAFTISKLHDFLEFIEYKDDHGWELKIKKIIDDELADSDDYYSHSKMKKIIKKICDDHNERLTEIQNRNKEQIILVRKFFCDNQGWLADFIFKLSSGHKKIKEEYSKERIKITKKYIGKTNQSNLEKELISLSKRLNPEAEKYRDESRKELSEICRKNFYHLTNIFKHLRTGQSGRMATPPRMTIKGYNFNENLAIDIFRLEKTYGGQSKANENSAFQNILTNGRYYICNDIPQASATLGKSNSHYQYLNPRLSNKKVIEYNSRMRAAGIPDDDGQWKECWASNVEGLEPPMEACYRSTLVIPITLLNNEVSKGLRNHFNIPLPSDHSLARAILGCVGLDHLERNYFIEETDREIGYYFADMISLYLITYLTYIDYSTTFNAIVNHKSMPNLKTKK
jgi:hypothetical protein